MKYVILKSCWSLKSIYFQRDLKFLDISISIKDFLENLVNWLFLRINWIFDNWMFVDHVTQIHSWIVYQNLSYHRKMNVSFHIKKICIGRLNEAWSSSCVNESNKLFIQRVLVLLFNFELSITTSSFNHIIAFIFEKHKKCGSLSPHQTMVEITSRWTEQIVTSAGRKIIWFKLIWYLKYHYLGTN